MLLYEVRQRYIRPLRGSMAKVRSVRFTTKEDQLIEEFIQKNSFFDFSTLAKIAILRFVKSPDLVVKPVSDSKTKKEEQIYEQQPN